MIRILEENEPVFSGSQAYSSAQELVDMILELPTGEYRSPKWRTLPLAEEHRLSAEHKRTASFHRPSSAILRVFCYQSYFAGGYLRGFGTRLKRIAPQLLQMRCSTGFPKIPLRR